MMDQINGARPNNKAFGAASKPAPAHEKTAQGVKVAKTDRFEQAAGVQLSEKAQDLLKQLRAKYRDTDFVIADYSSDEEASKLLAGGTKAYSVLIDPQTLEEMAADDEVRAKYEGMIDSTREEINSVVKELVENGKTPHMVGASVSSDGTKEMFAELEEMTEKRNEQIEASRKEHAEEKKKAEKEEKAERPEKPDKDDKPGKAEKPEKHGLSKVTRFVADTAEKLLDSIFRFFGISPKEDGSLVMQKNADKDAE